MTDLTRAEIEVFLEDLTCRNQPGAKTITQLLRQLDAVGNEAILSRAAYEGVGSLLLSVQKDCIAERARADAAAAQLREAEQLAWNNGRADLLREQNEARLRGQLWASRGTE